MNLFVYVVSRLKDSDWYPIQGGIVDDHVINQELIKHTLPDNHTLFETYAFISGESSLELHMEVTVPNGGVYRLTLVIEDFIDYEDAYTYAKECIKENPHAKFESFSNKVMERTRYVL